ncbi:unnamed protein product [Ceutorhynchus assimilis]|uniref:Uncharacterized protein n=1 Tax=Ceutorhynchus assimilis TaxID=467358 RepID=A0A9N9MD13_9CUCU|nr:unnamed protein product [Ceutorhynchus assimilis]
MHHKWYPCPPVGEVECNNCKIKWFRFCEISLALNQLLTCRTKMINYSDIENVKC